METKQTIKDFMTFLREKVNFPLVLAGIFLAYGNLMVQEAVGIDNEATAEYLNGSLIAQDRAGWNVIDALFDCYDAPILWVTCLAVVLLCVGILGILWGISEHLNLKVSRSANTMFLLVFLTFPYIAKMGIFNKSLLTMGWVLCLTAIALFCAYELRRQLKLKYIGGGLLTMLLVFMVEKAYAVLFIQGLLLFCLIAETQKHEKFGDVCRWAALLAGILAAALLAAILLTRAIQAYMGITPSGYTSSFLRYDFSGLAPFLHSLKKFVKSYFASETERLQTYMAERVYVCAVGVLACLAIFNSVRKKRPAIILWSLLTLAAANAVYLVSGNADIQYRSFCFNYAFLAVTVLIYFWISLGRGQKRSVLFVLACLWLAGNQSREMAEVYHTKYLSYQKDYQMAMGILEKIQEECGTIAAEQKPVVFLGVSDTATTGWPKVEEASMFAWDKNTSTQELTVHRVYKFYEMLGYSIKQPENIAAQETEIRQEAANMQSYPEDGCVKDTEDYIIVKLGDSFCEILSEDAEEIQTSDQVQGSVESYSMNGTTLKISGWVSVMGENAYENNISVVLAGEGGAYRIRAQESERSDVTELLNDGKNHDNSGFSVKAQLPSWMEPGEYHVYLEIRNGKGQYFLDTGEMVSLLLE